MKAVERLNAIIVTEEGEKDTVFCAQVQDIVMMALAVFLVMGQEKKNAFHVTVMVTLNVKTATAVGICAVELAKEQEK